MEIAIGDVSKSVKSSIKSRLKIKKQKSTMTDSSSEQHDSNFQPTFDTSLDSFYADILSKGFSNSVDAIDYCRRLSARHGFTIKQEQSTYRNIYVYCSREGFPDSLRNPKSNPKRRRPSKRCDCRWRVVLNENNGTWEFRKSLNPEASKHNHELMRPEEIEKGWPKEMLDLICELARQRLPTPDIRTRVQLLFSHIPWNERRFYNRLSEERQKIRIRDAESRVQQLNGLWSNVLATAAGSQELTDMVQLDINKIVDKLCSMTQTDSSTLPPPLMQEHIEQEASQDIMDTTGDSSQDEASHIYIYLYATKPSLIRKQSSKPSGPETPKGFTAVVMPQQVFYIKLHPHRVLQDVQQLQRRRSRSLAFSEDFVETDDISQQKKQRTPILMDIPQQQQQQQQHPELSLSMRQLETVQPHHHHQPQPPNVSAQDQPSSGFVYPPPYRDAPYFASTLYPVYPSPAVPSSSSTSSSSTVPHPTPISPRYMTSHHSQQHPTGHMDRQPILYSTGRPPLPMGSDEQQQQHQQQHPTSSTINTIPITPPSSTSTSSSPHTLRLSTPHPQSTSNMMPNPLGPTMTTSRKDSMIHITDLSSNPTNTPTPQQLQPPPSAYLMDHRLSLPHHDASGYPPLQALPPPDHPHHPHHPHHQQQPMYYSVSNQVFSSHNNDNNNNESNPSGVYYIDKPSSSSSSSSTPRMPPP
ncbi:uncharacterized protein BX664DRAFT_385720 [Halteromyces radiatus]|uniref:uncharacterized protein n=1 Tax=Halteromyces radiatus TaxID=101107 RepID=UPI00221FC8EC|nr:uncharacterized protein BX664DRAFT_385720 [Halteromyces radiatus]KAI8089191.1 hypothetical protein BX664DRAFT_385720 [Halteromyces radiatus]